RYPYAILMHGIDSDETEWTDDLKADEILDNSQDLAPMILVMPNGGKLMPLNAFPDKPSWETVVVKELLPLLEREYCVGTTREYRAIGGISRGGFWAFEIAFTHPDLFSAVGGHSPFFSAEQAPPAVNPLNLARSLSPESAPRIWLDTTHDDAYRVNVDLFRSI